MTLEDLYKTCALKGMSISISFNDRLNCLDFQARRKDLVARRLIPVYDILEMSVAVPCEEIIHSLECLLCEQEELHEGNREGLCNRRVCTPPRTPVEAVRYNGGKVVRPV